MIRWIQYGAACMAAAYLGCATGSKSNDSRTKSEPIRSKPEKSASSSTDDSPSYVSSRKATMVNSLSNNSLTSKTYSPSKAKSFAASLSSKDKDPRVIEGKVAAMRLGLAPMSEVLKVAQGIAVFEMKKNPDRSVSQYVKLDLALSAINNKRFALAEYFLTDLLKSKIPKLKAAAHNAIGVLDVRSGRYPEAVVSFKSALRANGSYRPALLNLGFLALHGGDIRTAKQMLGPMQGDWFVKSGLISIARYEGNDNRVEAMCRTVLDKKPNHKPTLYNCALHYLQAKRDFRKARELANKMVKAPGGRSTWDDRGYNLLTKIDLQQAKNRGGSKSSSGRSAPASRPKTTRSGGGN